MSFHCHFHWLTVRPMVKLMLHWWKHDFVVGTHYHVKYTLCTPSVEWVCTSWRPLHKLRPWWTHIWPKSLCQYYYWHGDLWPVLTHRITSRTVWDKTLTRATHTPPIPSTSMASVPWHFQHKLMLWQKWWCMQGAELLIQSYSTFNSFLENFFKDIRNSSYKPALASTEISTKASKWTQLQFDRTSEVVSCRCSSEKDNI